jgi:hypothetical protein
MGTRAISRRDLLRVGLASATVAAAPAVGGYRHRRRGLNPFLGIPK